MKLPVYRVTLFTKLLTRITRGLNATMFTRGYIAKPPCNHFPHCGVSKYLANKLYRRIPTGFSDVPFDSFAHNVSFTDTDYAYRAHSNILAIFIPDFADYGRGSCQRGEAIVLQSHAMRMQGEVRVRHDERETHGPESLPASILVASSKHEKTAVEKTVSL